jgi:hypothetical protein
MLVLFLDGSPLLKGRMRGFIRRLSGVQNNRPTGPGVCQVNYIVRRNDQE